MWTVVGVSLVSDLLAFPQANFMADNFQAVEVRCRIDWPKREIVIIPDDVSVGTSADVASGPSTNTFAVPDEDDDEEEESYAEESSPESSDQSEAEDVDNLADEEQIDDPSDDSKESTSRSWESIVLQPADVSSVSSVDQHEVKEQDVEAKHEKRLPSVGVDPTPVNQVSCDTTNGLESDVLGPVEPDAEAPHDTKTSSTTQLHSSEHNYKFPETCYQKVPEDAFSDWTMMKPMFMRIADMAWGESDHIPDIDFEKKIIHAASRCSLSRDSYRVDDHPNFKPIVGTEVEWTPDRNGSDSTFHCVPGQSLKYWAVDKRRYWIIKEGRGGPDMSSGWWIVEKPWELLSHEIQTQILDETQVDDCHKCWIVRNWESQMIGGTLWEYPPYWDTSFDQDLRSENESIYSAEHECESDLDEGDRDQINVFSEYPLGSILDAQYNTHEFFDSENSDSSGDSESVESASDEHSRGWVLGEESSLDDDSSYSGSSDDDSGSEESSEGSNEDEVASTTPQKYVANSSTEPIFIHETDMAQAGPSSFRNHGPSEVDEYTLTDPILGTSTASLMLPPDTCNRHGMKNPNSRFPEPSSSWTMSRLSRDIHSNLFEPAMMPSCLPYQEGPFSIDTDFCKVADKALPSPPTTAGSIKRTASEMESSALPDYSFSQDAQRVPVDTYSQPGLETISPEVKEAIASALAENDSTVAENDRPAKRTKSSHTPSKSLASHVTTAVVGALLGGLATVATLAALPNDYFA